MIALLDTSHDLRVCEAEIGCPVEQLLTPLTRFLPQYPAERFCIENGAFSKNGFNAKGFLSLLKRELPRRDRCRWVSVPDVVGSARRTLEVFDYWYPRLCGWPLAFVAQDGQEDMPIPWELIKAVFIGGSTEWKLSKHAKAIIKAAQAMDTWTHVGRVNDPERFEYFSNLGVDSVDGTGIALHTHQRIAIRDRHASPQLELIVEKAA